MSLLRSSTRASRLAPSDLPCADAQPGAVLPLPSRTWLLLPPPAPDMYTSLKARLNSENFHSPRKPSVPMLKDRIGGTVGVAEKSDDACRMVPSPPSVVAMSVLECSRSLPPLGPLVVYTGTLRRSWISDATLGSRMTDTSG